MPPNLSKKQRSPFSSLPENMKWVRKLYDEQFKSSKDSTYLRNNLWFINIIVYL